MKHLPEFIEYARKRHQIYKDREAGRPRPWTDDPILSTYRFTNVFRELDATTVWYRRHVREVYDGTPKVFLATILFRWFNRIQTGEALFTQTSLIHGDTRLSVGTSDVSGLSGLRAEPVAGAYLRGTVGTAALRDAIVAFCGRGPYVTGAYIITSPAGQSKLDGVLSCVDAIAQKRGLWEKFFSHRQRTLEETWETLCHEKHMGPFMAYEVVTDLRHTHLLRDAPDIFTWANPGPGAMRGLMRVYLGAESVIERAQKIVFKRHECIKMIHEMMLAVNEHELTTSGFWPQWEMRDVEHTLCEYDKMCRVLLGQGKPRGVYR